MTALTISFEQFDEACRSDWEWRNRSPHNTTESWLAPDMAGVRERVHERMRNTLSLLGITVVCPDCERCTWNPGPDCNTDPPHPRCERCGHCIGRHAGLPVSPHQP